MRITLTMLLAIFLGCAAYAQVNVQTGSASYSIPVFNYSDSKGVSTSVSLAYSSGSGFKPNELASNVGTGWDLMAGGFIQRIQAGEPDDQDSRQHFPTNGCTGSMYSTTNCYPTDPIGINYMKNYYPNGYMYSEYDNIDGIPNTAACLPHELRANPRFLNSPNGLANAVYPKWKMSRRALADRQQDRFMFFMNGRAGEFMIGKPSNGAKTILLPNGAKLKIDYDDAQDLSYIQVRTRIKSFTITDENGIIYKFNDYALTHVMEFGEDSTPEDERPQTKPIYLCPTSGSTAIVYNNGTNPYAKCADLYKTTPVPLSRTNPFVINKWYLSEIFNPLTNTSIYFQYTVKLQDNITGMSVSKSKYDEDVNEHINFFEQREVINNKLLNNIIFPDGHQLNFIYASTTRMDYKGNEPITKIQTQFNGKIISTTELNYDYFFGSTGFSVEIHLNPHEKIELH
jgi:hypothetical protein